MRADARTLLDRLGRSDFAYKEFADRFSDLELWPLFEALLKDPRVFEQGTVADAAEQHLGEAAGGSSNTPVSAPGIASARPADPGARRSAPATSSPAAPSLAQVFDRYEAGAGTAPPVRQGQDVRAMLRRLSDLDERGEL